jgi:hypothetical protein
MHRINIKTIKDYLGTWHKTISKNINTKQSNSIMGYTPLHIAVYYGYFDIVPILLEHGADVNIQDSRGNTVLHYLVTEAIYELHPEKLRLRMMEISAMLLKHEDIDINIVNQEGDTPLSALLKLDISREPSLKGIKAQLDEQFKEYMSNQKTQRRRMLIFH